MIDHASLFGESIVYLSSWCGSGTGYTVQQMAQEGGEVSGQVLWLHCPAF